MKGLKVKRPEMMRIEERVEFILILNFFDFVVEFYSYLKHGKIISHLYINI